MDMQTRDRDVFEVASDTEALWAMRKIAQANKDLAELEAFYARQLDKARNQAQATVDVMTSLLRAYFDRVPHRVTKTQQSYALPMGKLVCKQQEPEYTRDNQRLVAWMESAGRQDMVKTQKTADWPALKKVCVPQKDGRVVDAETGEVVDGVTATPREPVFQVVLNDGGGAGNV